MRKRCLLLFVLLLLCTHLLYAQDRTLSGKSLDPTGKPVPGASIHIKGTKKGTSSQVDGSYTLSVPEKTSALVISAIGWMNQEI